MSKPTKKRTMEARLRIFIENYRKTGRVMRACKASGIDHATHYRRLQSDATYRARVEEAEQQSAQYLEDTLYDMAMERDIQALLALLKRFRPELYRDRAAIDVAVTVDLVERIQEGHQRVIEMRKAADEVERAG